MYHETLLSDSKKLEFGTQVDSTSSMYLLPENQILLNHFTTEAKEMVLPPLDCIFLGVHLGGKPATWQEDTPLTSAPSNITFLPPRGPSSVLFEGGCDFTVFLIAGEAKKHILANLKNNQIFRFSDAIILSIAHQLTSESALADQDMAYCDCLTQALLQQLVRLVKSNQELQTNTSSFYLQQIQKAINYIHWNPREALTIEQLAQVAGLKPPWFRKLFKQTVGMTVRRYIMNQRLESAQDLLTNTSIPLLQLSKELGFSSQSHFTESFKRHYGKTPHQYRIKSPE